MIFDSFSDSSICRKLELFESVLLWDYLAAAELTLRWDLEGLPCGFSPLANAICFAKNGDFYANKDLNDLIRDFISLIL